MATMSLPNVLSRLGGARRLHVDLLVQVDVFGHHGQGLGVHGVDERLHVDVELRRLGLGADVGQIQTVAANQRRQELVGEHPLRVVRVEGSVAGRRVRAEDERLGGRAGAEVIRAHAVGGKAGIGERL